jgi:hypothetical protein
MRKPHVTGRQTCIKECFAIRKVVRHVVQYGSNCWLEILWVDASDQCGHDMRIQRRMIDIGTAFWLSTRISARPSPAACLFSGKDPAQASPDQD